jgi:hypothetical protein
VEVCEEANSVETLGWETANLAAALNAFSCAAEGLLLVVCHLDLTCPACTSRSNSSLRHDRCVRSHFPSRTRRCRLPTPAYSQQQLCASHPPSIQLHVGSAAFRVGFRRLSTLSPPSQAKSTLNGKPTGSRTGQKSPAWLSWGAYSLHRAFRHIRDLIALIGPMHSRWVLLCSGLKLSVSLLRVSFGSKKGINTLTLLDP